MKEAFIDKNFSAASLQTIRLVNDILEEYRRQGFRLSLRQLYYQLVARDYIPNNLRSYKNLGSLVSNARQAGEVDWDMIEDRNRETITVPHWKNPGQIVMSFQRNGIADVAEVFPCVIVGEVHAAQLEQAFAAAGTLIQMLGRRMKFLALVIPRQQQEQAGIIAVHDRTPVLSIPLSGVQSPGCGQYTPPRQ